ncbi:hypothetical protein GCM10007148_28450 [Parvularcula lutaonensis]|nr:hypothetical protein GCM10007148_28450 [Parvularcula lutaonensis]
MLFVTKLFQASLFIPTVISSTFSLVAEANLRARLPPRSIFWARRGRGADSHGGSAHALILCAVRQPERHF